MQNYCVIIVTLLEICKIKWEQQNVELRIWMCTLALRTYRDPAFLADLAVLWALRTYRDPAFFAGTAG